MNQKYTFAEILSDKYWIGILAFAVSLVATPIFRLIAHKTKIVDRPDELLKPHGRPVAYLGGLGICLGLLAGLFYFVGIRENAGKEWADLVSSLSAFDLAGLTTNRLWNLIGVIAASVAITIVGLLDDIYNLSPRAKLVGQVLAAGLLMIGGIGIHLADVFVPEEWVRPSPWVMTPASILLCIVTVIATCNATNLMDGLDGLCGGVTGIIALGFLALAVWLATWGNDPYRHDNLRVALCLAMAGGVMGFLPYNVPPASIFMGDAGSMLLGFFVAVMIALFAEQGNARWFIAALVVYALPILDTSLAVVRRLLGRKSIFTGDRSHFYDQLVDRGLSVKQVVALFYVLALASAALGVFVAVYVRFRYTLIIYPVLLALVWLIFGKLGMIRPEEHKISIDASKHPAPPKDA